MRIHHLNCGTMCPIGARWLLGGRTHLVAHCLLVEARDRLVLVDTGFGTQDVADPKRRLGASFERSTGPRLDVAETALYRVRALDFSPADVSDVCCTHLDLDHAGGLSDFPDANVHVTRRERDAALERKTLLERERYRPVQIEHGPKWVTHEPEGEKWEGFDAVRAIDGLDDDVLLVPLVGHTRGHTGVAIKTETGWTLHCGDSYFHHADVHPNAGKPPLMLTGYQKLLAVDEGARVANQRRLRELIERAGSRIVVHCAHDTSEYEALS